MKKFFKFALVVAAVAAACVACKGNDPEDPKKDEPSKEAVAPIIVNVVMPTEANALPGGETTIQGVGFLEGDTIECVGKDGQANFTPTVKVTSTGVTFTIPEGAIGSYTVNVTRNGKTATLDGTLIVPKVSKLENVVVPDGVFYWGDKVTITGDGIEPTDQIILECENYDDVTLEGAATTDKIEFTVANTMYGENKVKLIRDGGLTVLGTVKLGAKVLTEGLGGVCYYTTDDGAHGLVVYPECVTGPTVIWGPSIPRDPYDAGTEDGIYKGASNTEKLVAQYNKVMEDGTFSYADPSPAVVCSEFSANGYDDWYLPTKAELSELFFVKGQLAETGLFVIPANNYWTSCEFLEEAPTWDWAMWYVNFYEATDLVCWCASVDVWAIGTIAVRAF